MGLLHTLLQFYESRFLLKAIQSHCHISHNSRDCGTQIINGRSVNLTISQGTTIQSLSLLRSESHFHHVSRQQNPNQTTIVSSVSRCGFLTPYGPSTSNPPCLRRNQYIHTSTTPGSSMNPFLKTSLRSDMDGAITSGRSPPEYLLFMQRGKLSILVEFFSYFLGIFSNPEHNPRVYHILSIEES